MINSHSELIGKFIYGMVIPFFLIVIGIIGYFIGVLIVVFPEIYNWLKERGLKEENENR